MELTCPSCHKRILLKQKYFYHAGFSDEGFMYCDNDSTTLKFSSYDKIYESIVGPKHPWSLNESEKVKVENELKNCPCGGKFRFANLSLCPLCRQSIQSLIPAKIYFIEFDRIFDAEKDSMWLLPVHCPAYKLVKLNCVQKAWRWLCGRSGTVKWRKIRDPKNPPDMQAESEGK